MIVLKDDLSPIDYGSDGDGINWDIPANGNTESVIEEIKPVEGNVAKGEDAQTVLLNTTSRNHLINELLEVRNYP